MHPGRIYVPDCTDGAFGPGCLSDCHCRDKCDVISGHCSSQCEDGWVGSDCQRSMLAVCISDNLASRINFRDDEPYSLSYNM